VVVLLGKYQNLWEREKMILYRRERAERKFAERL